MFLTIKCKVNKELEQDFLNLAAAHSQSSELVISLILKSIRYLLLLENQPTNLGAHHINNEILPQLFSWQPQPHRPPVQQEGKEPTFAPAPSFMSSSHREGGETKRHWLKVFYKYSIKSQLSLSSKVSFKEAFKLRYFKEVYTIDLCLNSSFACGFVFFSNLSHENKVRLLNSNA